MKPVGAQCHEVPFRLSAALSKQTGRAGSRVATEANFGPITDASGLVS